MRPTRRDHACVLGAGIQGVTAALALARDGRSVTLLERSDHPFRGASFRGEGKIHLGYVYANDPSHRTARLMAEAAFCFDRLLGAWLGDAIDWRAARSDRFTYAVLADSMVDSDGLLAHYAVVDEFIGSHLSDGLTYAGRSDVEPVRPLGDPARHGFGERAEALVRTDEVSLDPMVVGNALLAGLDAADVAVHCSTEVLAVERRPESFSVTCRTPSGAATHRADVVVNCMWDGRLVVDETMGVAPPHPWNYRLKYGVHARVRPGCSPIPTVTFALGPFGDIVRRADDHVYLSWDPECLVGWSSDIEIPDAWRSAMSGRDPWSTQREIADRTIGALAELVPAVAHLEPTSAAAGVIVARGDTDIDDHASALHQRRDIGVHDHDGYFSIDTGKLTCAPMFADELAGRVR
jgi:2-polyprenyl-6-methoxyphenol hydroxylase-like FAD-dependent oxidoreductase